MRELPFGEHGVDAFLDGKILADDAPRDLQDLARLVHAARAPATAGELVGEDRVVAALAAAAGVGAGISGTAHEGRRPMLTKLLTAKMAAAAAVAVLGGGVAAAATGSLPPPLQSTVSHGLSSVGISVPSPGGQGAGHAASASSGRTGAHGTGATTTNPPAQAVGPLATGPAVYGLCTEYGASTGSKSASHSVALRNLSAAAAAKGETVAQYCTGVTPPTTGTSGSSETPAAVGPPSGTSTGSGAGQGGTNATTHVPTTVNPPASSGNGSGTPGRPSTSPGSAS